MKAILTVIGKDKPGIVAGISDELYKQHSRYITKNITGLFYYDYDS